MKFQIKLLATSALLSLLLSNSVYASAYHKFTIRNDTSYTININLKPKKYAGCTIVNSGTPSFDWGQPQVVSGDYAVIEWEDQDSGSCKDTQKYQSVYITFTDKQNKTWGEYVGVVHFATDPNFFTYDWANALFYAEDITGNVPGRVQAIDGIKPNWITARYAEVNYNSSYIDGLADLYYQTQEDQEHVNPSTTSEGLVIRIVNPT